MAHSLRIGWALAKGIALALGLLLTALPARAAPDCADSTCQGWAEHERSWWYSVSQGSRLLPLSWMIALEASGSQVPLLSAGEIGRFNYLPNPASDDNPYGLPLGFAVDQEEGGGGPLCRLLPQTCGKREPWVGLNCAACHTNELTFAGRRIRVEGAPTLADFQGFTEEVLKALEATRTDPAKFERFAAAVAGTGSSARAALRNALDEQIAWQQRLQGQSRTPLRYGFGRLDAQGHILNKVALVVHAQSQPPFPADAPASYPQLWNVPQQDRLQWNGVAENGPKLRLLGRTTDWGALGRNTGEVIGVFADVDVGEREGIGYESSLRLKTMIDLERQLERLQPPRWPDALPPIDRALAERGRPLFEANCQSCHQPLGTGDLKTPVKVVMQPLEKGQTDIWLACNTYRHRANAGLLEGRREAIGFQSPKIQANDYTRAMLKHVIIGSIAGKVDELGGSLLADIVRGVVPFGVVDPTPYLPGVANPEKKRQAAECLTTNDPILAYKARPLNGIWATAPYLHNGSVPTLYDLLLPASVRNHEGIPASAAAGARRPDSFRVGSREFDPVKVGFATGAGEFEFRVRDAAGTPILGNYNSGHEGAIYGTEGLDEAGRMALVEYMKTL